MLTTDTLTAEPDWAFSTLTPDTLLDAIDSLGWQTDGRLLALNSYENRVYQVGIEDQPPLIAKFYRPNRWNAAQLQEELRFVQALDQAEVPVVAPLAAPATGELLNTVGGYAIAVYPRRGGHSLEVDQPEQLYRVGLALGRLHAVGAAEAFRARPSLSIEDFGYQAASTILDSGILPGALAENYQRVSEQLLDGLEQFRSRLEGAKALRCHGDCHVSNILVRDEQLLMVDFDDARMAPAIQDLWMFLSGDQHNQRAALSELLEGYQEFSDFDQRELALIEPLRSLRLMHYARWLTERRDDPAFQQAFPWFYQERFWEEHIHHLREQVVAIQAPSLSLQLMV